MAISTGRPIRPKGVCEIANGFSSAVPAIAKHSVSVAQESTAFTRVFLEPSSGRQALRDLVELLLPAVALERIPARPTRKGIAPAFLRAVSALPAQTGCGAALRNTKFIDHFIDLFARPNGDFASQAH